MAAFQDILDAVAKIVGGTGEGERNPGFFSGWKLGDGTGISGLHGAYSYWPETIQDAPVAIVVGGAFTQQLGEGGPEEWEDNIRILTLVSRNDPQTQMRTLAGFRDSIPAAFRAKMELGLPHGDVLYGYITAGSQKVYEVGGVVYDGWEFTLTVPRAYFPSYTA